MFTLAHLKNRSAKDLAKLAQKKKVRGWHSMRKEELILVLSALARPGNDGAAANGKPVNGKSLHGKTANGNPVNGRSVNGNGQHGVVEVTSVVPQAIAKNGSANGKTKKSPPAAKPRSPELERRLAEVRSRLNASKDLALRAVAGDVQHAKERLVVMVRDSYWLHAYWEISRRSIQRAEAALGQYWHGAKPVLRVMELVRDGTTHASRKHVRDIEVHGGVHNWYVDVHTPPKTYQLEIGYLAAIDKFHCLARSNVVSTPPVGENGAFDKNWAEVAKDFDRIYALSGGYNDQDPNVELKEVMEERLHRPLGESVFARYGMEGIGEKRRRLNFEIHTELIVHGTTDPCNRVTLRGEPIPVREDGSFAVRFNLPDRRHVMPVVASSSDGVEQRTIVLAVDRNTKVMEPVIRDPGD